MVGEHHCGHAVEGRVEHMVARPVEDERAGPFVARQPGRLAAGCRGERALVPAETGAQVGGVGERLGVELHLARAGERARVSLARVFARESNLLVLDEPTNDLDLETLDLLQEVIADYGGTVLIVSHDRDFLDKTVTITLGLDGSGRVDVVAGGYEDWEKQRRQANASPKRTTPAKPGAAPPSPSPSAKSAKLSYKDQRDYDLLPAKIEALEAAIAKDETELADPDLYTKNPARFAALMAAIDKARTEKDAAEERWLELAAMVEEMGI